MRVCVVVLVCVSSKVVSTAVWVVERAWTPMKSPVGRVSQMERCLAVSRSAVFGI